MRVIARVLLLSILCAMIAPLSAQEVGKRVSVDTMRATVDFIAGEPAVSALVRGAPYAAEATTTVSQTLADGTRIERTTVAKLFRDTEGRTRREQTVLGLDALRTADPPSIVTISDPVAGVSYVLEPDSRRAHKAAFGALAMRTEKMAVAFGSFEPMKPPPPPPPPGPGEPRARFRTGGPNVANVPEPLGTRLIEGVNAVGTKRTEIIPAGAIGNDRPIEITDERWESPELKVTLLSRHHDPRTGDVEYRLTNLTRAEPTRDLFTVPSDYTVVDAREDRERQ